MCSIGFAKQSVEGVEHWIWEPGAVGTRHLKIFVGVMQKKASTLPAPSPATAAAPAAPAPPTNPIGGMGGMGGLGGGLNPATMAQAQAIMNNPAMMAQAQQMMAHNPQAAAMLNNPAMMAQAQQMMQDPQAMQQIMDMMNQGGGGLGGGMGGGMGMGGGWGAGGGAGGFGGM